MITSTLKTSVTMTCELVLAQLLTEYVGWAEMVNNWSGYFVGVVFYGDGFLLSKF